MLSYVNQLTIPVAQRPRDPPVRASPLLSKSYITDHAHVPIGPHEPSTGALLTLTTIVQVSPEPLFGLVMVYITLYAAAVRY